MDSETESLFFASIFLDIANINLLFYISNFVILGVLLLLSGLISGSEIGLFSISSEDLDHCQDSEDTSERLIVQLLQRPQRLLATILIFNNLINVAIVTIATYLTWQIVGTRNPVGIVILTLTVVVTVAILFFGELLPKVYANQRNLFFVRRTARLINVAMRIFKPLSYVLMQMSNVVEKRIKKRGYPVDIKGLEDVIDRTNTSTKQREILKGIVNFGTITAKQVMTSRLAVTAFDINTNFHELIDKIQECGYSRIPIYSDTIDNIKGILYVKDLLPFLNANESFKWAKLLRKTYFIPPNKKIDKLLRDFQERRVHMAIVVDEYGGTAGLVTMEDVIEEIVGEVNDEFDGDREKLYTKIDENSYLFESKISLHDFCKIMGIDNDFFDEVKGESKSLGGLLLERFARLPKLNENIVYDKFEFTVVSMGLRKIKIVKVEIHEDVNDEKN